MMKNRKTRIFLSIFFVVSENLSNFAEIRISYESSI